MSICFIFLNLFISSIKLIAAGQAHYEFLQKRKSAKNHDKNLKTVQSKKHFESQKFEYLKIDEAPVSDSPVSQYDYGYYDFYTNSTLQGYAYFDIFGSEDCSGNPIYESGIATSVCQNSYGMSYRVVSAAGIVNF
jgi:hypothetical protein